MEQKEKKGQVSTAVHFLKSVHDWCRPSTYSSPKYLLQYIVHTNKSFERSSSSSSKGEESTILPSQSPTSYQYSSNDGKKSSVIGNTLVMGLGPKNSEEAWQSAKDIFLSADRSSSAKQANPTVLKSHP